MRNDEPSPVTSRSAAQHDRWRPWTRTATVLALVLLLALSATVYLAVGWRRMDNGRTGVAGRRIG